MPFAAPVAAAERGTTSSAAARPGVAPAGTGARLDAVAKQYGFQGEYLVSRGAEIWNVDSIPRPAKDRAAPRLWRWASVTKQVVATLIMQEVARGRVDLDRPVAAYLLGFRSPNAAAITVRQLLRHQTGLPNPDDTAMSGDAMPAYYRADYAGSRDPLTGYCAGPVKGPPGEAWAYNNCDYIVAGALLEAVTGKRWQTLVQQRLARPLGLRSLSAFVPPAKAVPGSVDGRAEPAFDPASFGAAAGLYGTARDLLLFDRALMAGKLLPAEQRAAMWDGQPKLGFIALGQWAFSVPVRGCAAPVRIIERRGAIGGVEVRNFILPDQDVVAIAFVNRSGFDFGEVWQGNGFSHDLLAAAACP